MTPLTLQEIENRRQELAKDKGTNYSPQFEVLVWGVYYSYSDGSDECMARHYQKSRAVYFVDTFDNTFLESNYIIITEMEYDKHKDIIEAVYDIY